MTGGRWWVALGAMLAACTTQNVGLPGNLGAVADMVLVDDRPPGTGLADQDGGVANRYLFVTSSTTNDLRVINLYFPARTPGRTFLRAPNPLEPLAIPVIDRPARLAVDEGLTASGRRATGAYVYAARPGGSQISVVDASPQGMVQVGSSPLAAGAPVTAMAAWMGQDLIELPATTTLYYATYDGAAGSVFALTLPTAKERHGEIPAAIPARVLDLGDEAVSALAIVPGLEGRQVDGVPFCAGTSACLAVATRRAKGTAGRTMLVELGSARTATLAFPTPVRELATSHDGRLIYGALDEEACTPSVCGGVIGVDTSRGTASAGFPLITTFASTPMVPLEGLAGLPRDIHLARFAGLRQAVEIVDAGVGLVFADRQYEQLGFFSTSAGEIIPFDAVNGSRIDFDGRRTRLSGASLRIPGALEDGGYGFFLADGGPISTLLPALILDAGVPLTPAGDATLPVRSFEFIADGGLDRGEVPFTLELGDGLLSTQNITLSRRGILIELSALPTSPAEGDTVAFAAGLERRMNAGDEVIFGVPVLEDGGVVECGSSTVTGVAAGSATLTPVPAACAARSRFTVRAGPTRPIVVTGGVEGFIGRVDVGETLTYIRNYQTRPEGFDGVRPAMVLTVGSMPDLPGTLWTLGIDGFLNPYALAFSGCGITTLPGTVLGAQLPTYVNVETPLVYLWHVLGLYPSGPSVTQLSLSAAVDSNDGASPIDALSVGVTCYR